jgi:hypothetical protein
MVNLNGIKKAPGLESSERNEKILVRLTAILFALPLLKNRRDWVGACGAMMSMRMLGEA